MAGAIRPPFLLARAQVVAASSVLVLVRVPVFMGIGKERLMHSANRAIIESCNHRQQRINTPAPSSLCPCVLLYNNSQMPAKVAGMTYSSHFGDNLRARTLTTIPTPRLSFVPSIDLGLGERLH